MRFVALAILGLVAGVFVGGCGGGEGSAVGTGITATRTTPTRTLPTVSAPATTVALPETTTVAEPATTIVTAPMTTQIVTTTAPLPPRITVATTATQVATVVQTVTQTPTETTETSGINPAAAAAAAAAASNDDDSNSTQWGWIAFGILATAVLVFGIVWWIRRRHAKSAVSG